MKKKSLTLLLPSLLSGCTAFNATPVPDTTPPALVFVDGQIRESAAIIAHTQKRLLPPPVTRPVTPPRPTTTATPTTAVSSQSTALPPRPLLQATQLPALVMTGKPGQSSVVYLREAHQRSVSDWIRQLLPPGWQFRQQNAAIPALNKRLPVWSVNDQWHRALNALLAGQQLYGHMDWNRKILTVTTSATPPVDVTAPQGSQKAADTPRNPFRGSTATPAGPTPVTPAVSVSRAQTTTGTSGTPESRTTTPAPVATKPVVPPQQKVIPPRQWKMGNGTTLKDGLARWTSSEKCPHGTWTLRWETPVNYSIDAPLVFTGSFRQALEQLFALYTPAEKPLYARTSTAQCLLRVTDRPHEQPMGWVTGFIMVIMAIGNFWFHSHLSRTVHHQQTAEITQQAADFIRYMNAINDYLYQHPERRAAGGQLTSAQLGLPATKNVSHLISQQRVFVWAKEKPGLMGALLEQSGDSALLARVENGRLLDTRGRRISITLPAVIPDQVIIWMN